MHDFKTNHCQKSPTEELIVLCITDHTSSDISKEMIVIFFSVYTKHDFFMLVLNYFLCFLLLFSSKCRPNLGYVLYIGVHYTLACIIHG